jgi:large subunit ribosomal protein L25
MADITIAAQSRNETGSGHAGRLRASGRIPGIVYGKGVEPYGVSVDHREFRNTFNHVENRSETISLMVDGVAKRVKIQEIQRDPVKGTAAHVDFIAV